MINHSNSITKILDVSNIIKKLVIILDNKKINLSLFEYVTHIYLYLLFFYKIAIYNNNLKTTNIDIDVDNTYNQLINNFIPYIKNKFNYKLNEITYDSYKNFINETNIIEEITKKHNYNELICNIFKEIKELKTYYKELKSFFTEQNTIKNIKEILKANNLEIIDNTTILNLFSGSGNLINCLYDLNNINNKLNSNNITLCDNNKLLNIIAYANLQINTGISFDNQYNIIETDLLHDNRITNNYDIIIADLPHDIRNIIHAECCNKIKQYKIRGTKSEPLILQLIMSLLNQNGLAIIIVPDSMLFGESNQHIETRKYLFNNFNLQKVIGVADKKSILVFKNNGKTTEINFIKKTLSYENNTDKNDREQGDKEDYNCIISLDESTINSKKYSFYYHNYENINNNIIKDSNINTISDMLTILTSYPDINLDREYLICYKTNLFKIIKLNNLTENIAPEYIFVSKDESQYKQTYLNYYLFNLFNKNINSITKGKIKQLDIDAINNYVINIPSNNIQLNIINIINNNNKIIELNKKQIENYEELKINHILNIMSILPTDKLSNICKISHSSSIIDTIVINRNSTLCGTVSLTETETETTTNNYYLDTDVLKISNNYLYIILKFYEPKLKEISKSNNTINLGKNKLENLDIPLFTQETKYLIEKCIKYNDKINILQKLNDVLTITDSLFLE